MAAIAISFALALRISEYPWVAKIGEFMKVYFKIYYFTTITTITIYKQLIIFFQFRYFFVLLSNWFILFCEGGSIGLLWFCFLEELINCFLFFLLKKLFFSMLGFFLVLYFFEWRRLLSAHYRTLACSWRQNLRRIDIWRSKRRKSTCWYVKHNASKRCSILSLLLSSKIWYVNLGIKIYLVLALDKAIFFLTKDFSYVVAELKKLLIG